MIANQHFEKFRLLPFGSIKPDGWLKAQMQKDMAGFTGHLDQLVPGLFNDPIYGAGRLNRNSKARDLGNLKAGDAEGGEQYKWWNSETQSNWWDGYIRSAFLLEQEAGIEKARQYIQGILATQDEDGYLGIYDRETRYNFHSENGELWSKTTLYRGLLAYCEKTKSRKAWLALVKAVENVMQNYPAGQSSPFDSGRSFNGGVSHGLTFTDVLDKMHQLTSDKRYLEYAVFLYRDFSNTFQSEGDAQLENILNPDYRLKSHGVHTCEHIRPLAVAAYASQNPLLLEALSIYLERIKKLTTPSGGAIGDEWIDGRDADATDTGYEYCSLHELLDSYTAVLQKSGKAETGDDAEKIFYNAAQGSRNPLHSCIAYLKTDNSYEMLGTKNGVAEPGRKQTRYKYSPAHQDVAVCCNPNAGRITPYFIQSSWMKEGANTLVATLLMPNILSTEIGGARIEIRNITSYPFANEFIFRISLDKAAVLNIKIRKPAWVTEVDTDEGYTLQDGYLSIERKFRKQDEIALRYKTEVKVLTDKQGERYFTYGALVFAKPIDAEEIRGKAYSNGFEDLYYKPGKYSKYLYCSEHEAAYANGRITAWLINENSGKKEKVELMPIGKTILRQTAFKEQGAA